jgi:flagellar hook-length control protein FliK
MLGAGMILGAPSLPKLTPTRRDSADADPAPSTAAVRRTSTPFDLRKQSRADFPSSPPASPAPKSPTRRSSGIIPVAGRPSGSPPAAGRPVVPFHRVIDAALRLHPATCTCLRLSLGELTIELKLRGGVLQGTVETPNQASRDAVAAQLDQYRSALDRQGISVGELRVVVSGSLEEVEGPVSLRRSLLDLWA